MNDMTVGALTADETDWSAGAAYVRPLRSDS